MRAVLLTGHGGYDKLDLRDDVPVLMPGRGDVLICVRASAVNSTDINTRIGWYSKAVAEATDAGAVTGIENAGDDGWSAVLCQRALRGEAFARTIESFPWIEQQLVWPTLG